MIRIGRLAYQSGVSTDSIRYYQRQGLIAPARKTAAGYHLYDSDALRRLAFIKHAQRCGFDLDEIRRFLEGGASSDALELARRKLPELKSLRGTLAEMERALETLLEEPAIREDVAKPHDLTVVAALEAAVNSARGGRSRDNGGA